MRLALQGQQTESGIAPGRVSARCASLRVVSGLVAAGDAVVIFASGAFAHWLAPLAWRAEAAQHLGTYAFAALLTLHLVRLVGGYRAESEWSLGGALGRLMAGWFTTVGIAATLSWSVTAQVPFAGVWFLGWVASATAGLVFVRTVACVLINHLHATGAFARRVAIVGCGADGQEVLARYATERPGDVRVVGVFDDRVRRTPHFCWGYPNCGDVDALVAFARHNAVDDVIVALPMAAEKRLRELLARLRVIASDLHVVASGLDFAGDATGLARMGGVATIRIIQRPLADWRLVAKELEDRILGTAILALISPVLLVIAALIKLDSPGPVLFRQQRYGFNNRMIEVFKFRTMRADLADNNAERLTTRDDPRVTRLGRILRRTSLDELPQFINVVRGEMSIVGPRPHARAAKAAGILYADAVEAYAARHKVKPGITGLAQINGWRGETRTLEQIHQRVAHDMDYIRNWSLWLDLKIIVITAFTGFSSRDAY